MPTVDDLVVRKQQVEAQFLALPGVTGVDVGFKEVGGHLTDQLSVRVHVAAKRDDVPDAQRIPLEVDGIPTDVLERNYELQVKSVPLDFSIQADSVRYDPLLGGISIGPSRVIGGSVFTGTLGAVVIDNGTNRRAALTNFHVACVDTGWSVGDRMAQPSRVDTGVVPGDEVGALLRATLSGAVDGAVISLDPGRGTRCEVAEIGQVRGTKVAALGMRVRKRGRTTGLTYGSVDGVSLTVNVDYGNGIGVRTLTNQVSVTADTARNPRFSDRGDSGSVILDDDGYVVALLFAGSGTSTVGNQIAAVLSELNIRICTSKVKSLKETVKDTVKDKEFVKEIRKDVVKDGAKDVVKDSKEDIKEIRKEKDIKEIKEKDIKDKDLKDLSENPPKRIGDNIPIGPIERVIPRGGGGPASLEARLGALEEQLAALVSFISPELRPDLRSGAFSGEADVDVDTLRAALEEQAAAVAQAKADLDNLQG